MTFFHKFLLPGIFVLGVLNTLFFWGPIVDTALLSISAAFLFVSLLLAWRLKYVAIDSRNRCLVISNYREQICVPFSDISDVSEFPFAEPRRVTIRFRHPNKFGSKTIFIGTYRFGGVFAGPHPVVAELRSLIV